MKIFIFDQDDNLRAIAGGEGPETLPVNEAKHKEQVNGENTLEILVAGDHQDSEHIKEEHQVAYKDKEGDYRLFIIKRLEEEHDNEELKIRAFCIGAEDELIDEYIKDKRPSGSTARYAMEQFLQGTRWSVGKIDDLGTNSITAYYESTLSAILGIANTWNGELKFRITMLGSKIAERKVDLLARRGYDLIDTGKRFVFGKDILKVTRTTDTNNLKTALIGRGKGEETEGRGYGRRILFEDIVWSKANGDPADKPAGQEWIGDPVALAQFGRLNANQTRRHRIGVFEDSEETDPGELLRKTWEELQKQNEPLVSYAMTVKTLAEITGLEHEIFYLGNTILAIDRYFKPELRVTARILEIVWNLLEPEESELVLGNFLRDLTDDTRLDHIAAKINQKSGEWDDKYRPGDPIATAWLEGVIDVFNNEIQSTGGYVYFTDTDGLIVYDRPKDQNPTKAMQIKSGGWRLASQKNPDGTWKWRTAATADGFVADEITTGVLNAALVKILGTNKFYWDSTGIKIEDPADSKKHILINEQGIRFTKDGGQAYSVAIGFDGLNTSYLEQQITEAQDGAEEAKALAIQAQVDAETAKSTSANAQNLAFEARSDADEAQAIAEQAQADADEAKGTLADISSDSKLTPSEKKSVKKEWDIIAGEKEVLMAQAEAYEITTEKNNYVSTFKALAIYLNKGQALGDGETPAMLASLETTDDITGSILRATFRAYYDARTALLNKITDKTKVIADLAETASAAAQAIAESAETAANAAQDAAEALAERVSTAESSITQNAEEIALKVSKDGVISAINQTAEQIKISAKKLQLDGDATFSGTVDTLKAATIGNDLTIGTTSRGTTKLNLLATAVQAGGSANLEITAKQRGNATDVSIEHFSKTDYQQAVADFIIGTLHRLVLFGTNSEYWERFSPWRNYKKGDLVLKGGMINPKCYTEDYGAMTPDSYLSQDKKQKTINNLGDFSWVWEWHQALGTYIAREIGLFDIGAHAICRDGLRVQNLYTGVDWQNGKPKPLQDGLHENPNQGYALWVEGNTKINGLANGLPALEIIKALEDNIPALKILMATASGNRSLLEIANLNGPQLEVRGNGIVNFYSGIQQDVANAALNYIRRTVDTNSPALYVEQHGTSNLIAAFRQGTTNKATIGSDGFLTANGYKIRYPTGKVGTGLYADTSDGREAMLIRTGTSISNGIGINMYTDADPSSPNQMVIYNPAGEILRLNADRTARFMSSLSVENNKKVMHEGQMASGKVTITPTANSPTGVTVTFGKTFSSVPNITTAAQTAVPGSTLIETSFSAPTTTSCKIYLYRTNATATSVCWIATDV